jgi:hypothetical protein
MLQVPIRLYGENRNLNSCMLLYTYSKKLNVSAQLQKLQFCTLLHLPVKLNSGSRNSIALQSLYTYGKL